MPRFKIGQKVVVVDDNETASFKKGDLFTVDGFSCCPNCGIECLYLRGFNRIKNMYCSQSAACTFIEVGIREKYRSIRFAPIEPQREKITYKFKVNIPKPEIIEREQLIGLKELIQH